MSRHYQHHGSAVYLEGFWSRVDVRRPGDCWEWRRGRLASGYGQARSRKNHKAHRLAWCLANGRDIADDLVIRHACDNPPCCNPAHLVPGTHADNIKDSIARKRRFYQKRTTCRSGRHALTPENLRIGRGIVRCRECANEGERRRWPARRAAILAKTGAA